MAHRDARTWQHYPIEKQETQPLPSGNLLFRSYLAAHSLTIFEVAKAPEVRLATLWNVQQNIPIRAEREQAVRILLRRMTGIAYTGPIVVHADEPTSHKQPTMQRRRPHETL